jgi:hypothetical protein
MKKFLKYVLGALVLLYVLLVFLDFLYTSIYEHPVHARDKVSWLNNLKPDQFDYAIFGSSRAFFNLNPQQIKIETGLNGINLAYPASDNFEIKLMINQFLKHQKTKKIFIQVDDRYNSEQFNATAIVPWLPYIRENSIYREIHTVDPTAFYDKYVPFYRYMMNDSKLGFREIIMCFTKPNKFGKTNGFTPLYGEMKNDKFFTFELEDTSNKHLEAIIEICKKEEIELYFFTAPYYKTQFNAEVLSKHLPNYQDFSGSIGDKDCFRDVNHLNKKGAEKFTSLFSNIYFKNVVNP